MEMVCIDVLADHFADKYSKANGLPLRAISDTARETLRRHAWLCNVRELENTMHRAVLLAKGPDIGPEAIILRSAAAMAENGASQGAPEAIARERVKSLVGRTVADVERDLILDTLNHCLGNRTHAANILGISIRTLRNKLKQYSGEGVPVPSPGDLQRAAM